MIARPNSNIRRAGYSLVELLVATAILTVLMAAMITLMSRMQSIYTNQARVGGVNQTAKSAMELLQIDLDQAGYPGGVSATTSAAIVFSTTGQLVLVSNVSGMFVNRVVTLDTGTNTESVRITAVAASPPSITGVFKLNHASGVAIRASLNAYPQGILNTTTYPSTGTTLRIMGDLQTNGTLRYVEYRFTAAASTCTGTLVRSDTDAFATTQTAAVTVAERLCNAASVFTYSPTPTTLGNFTYVTNVVVTLDMQTEANVQRGAGGPTRTVLRRTFSPRNVMLALTLSQDGLQTVLPVAPGSVLATLPAAP